MIFERFLQFQAELMKKFRAHVPQRFLRNDRLDTERYLLNRPHGRVKQRDTKPEKQKMF